LTTWKAFRHMIVIPLHSQTARQASGSSQGLQLSESPPSLQYQLCSGSHFVSGKQGQSGQVLFNEVVYFHTSLCLSPLVELVSLSTRADGSQDAVGSGFGLLQLFTGRADSSISQGEGTLLHPTLKDPLQCECNPDSSILFNK
uniref:Uncharacterized protein n=2 Tax=Cyprinus carpio TaxID=7962 RepID=A0A9J7X313_CYPCA